MSPSEFEVQLMELDPEGDDFQSRIAELVDLVPKSQQHELIPSMFRYVEAYPEFSNGSPGKMVHVIERYYPSYKTMLLNSLGRSPSLMGVWMVNRILNSKLDMKERTLYKTALESVQENLDAPESVRNEAADFLKFQEEKRE